jgi:C4-dicarboxylate-specific signal transduction histidine kinase
MMGRELRSPHRPQAVDFALVEAMKILEPRAQSQGIRCIADVATMPLLPFDGASLRAIVLNLVQNALQACKPGDTVRLEGALVDGLLRFSVEDDGPGMTTGAESLAAMLERASTMTGGTIAFGAPEKKTLEGVPVEHEARFGSPPSLPPHAAV